MVFPVDNVGAPFCHEIGHLGLKIRKIFACGAQKYRLTALAGEIADPRIAGKRPLAVVHRRPVVPTVGESSLFATMVACIMHAANYETWTLLSTVD